MKKIKITMLLILLATFSFAQTSFVDFKKDNYSISYPKNWRLDISGQMNTSFILFSEIKEKDLLGENINLLIQDLKGQGFTMDSYVKLSENQIEMMIQNGKIIESKYNEEKKCHIVVWSGFVNNRNLKFKQYYFLKDEKAYILTLTTLPETYEDYIEIGNKILNTFKIKK